MKTTVVVFFHWCEKKNTDMGGHCKKHRSITRILQINKQNYTLNHTINLSLAKKRYKILRFSLIFLTQQLHHKTRRSTFLVPRGKKLIEDDIDCTNSIAFGSVHRYVPAGARSSSDKRQLSQSAQIKLGSQLIEKLGRLLESE